MSDDTLAIGPISAYHQFRYLFALVGKKRRATVSAALSAIEVMNAARNSCR